jgi:predicted RNA polymerase sigma factor
MPLELSKRGDGGTPCISNTNCLFVFDAGPLERLRPFPEREMMPAKVEVQGLLAMMKCCETRRNARRSEAGEYVPLGKQNVALWSGSALVEAETLLEARVAYSRAIGLCEDAAMRQYLIQQKFSCTPFSS